MRRLLGNLVRLFFDDFKIALHQGLRADEGVTVMRNVNFGSEPYLIHLHKYVRISTGVTFITHDGGTWAFRCDNEKYKDVVKFGTIEVGEYTFIGANAIILPDVHIGSHCVIAAGAVCTKNVEDGTVVAGTPARVICKTSEYADKCLQKMPVNFNQEEFKRNKRKYLTELMFTRGGR